MFYDLISAKKKYSKCLEHIKGVFKKDIDLVLSQKDLKNICEYLDNPNNQDKSLFELALTGIWSYYFSLNKEILFYQMYNDLLDLRDKKKLVIGKRLLYFVRILTACVGYLFNNQTSPGVIDNKINIILRALELTS